MSRLPKRLVRSLFSASADLGAAGTERRRPKGRSCRIEALEPRLFLAGDIALVRHFDLWDGGIIRSTDASGITYHPPSGHLLIADSEIDQTGYFVGNNVFEVSLAGDTVYAEYATGNSEPTGITYSEFDGFYYVTNDDLRTISRYGLALNSALATASTKDADSVLRDPEGIASDSAGNLYVVNGRSGATGIWVAAFDANLQFLYKFSVSDRMADAEGIAYDRASRHLYLVSQSEMAVFEYTLEGMFVDEYDIRGFSPAPRSPQGLCFAPTSDPDDGPGAMALYIADGGVDDQPDGRVYEAVITSRAALSVDFLELHGLDLLAGDLLYNITTVRSATLTLETSSIDAQLTLLDADFRPLQVSAPFDGRQRIDWPAEVGEVFNLRVGGVAANVDLHAANLVRRQQRTVAVYGTADDDHFVFDASARRFSINGLGYEFSPVETAAYSFDGLGGRDRVQFAGSDGPDAATLYPTSATLSGAGYSLSFTGVESTAYDGAGGFDSVSLYGSQGADTYTAWPGKGEMAGDGVSITVAAELIYARGGGGTDRATVYDSPADDLYEFFPVWARVTGPGYFHHLLGFVNMFGEAALGKNGVDRVIFRGSPAADWVKSTTLTTRMLTLGAWRHATGFDTITAYGRGEKGSPDRFVVEDTPGEDTLKLRPLETHLIAPAYGVSAFGFGTVQATRANPDSNDHVALEDSAGDDVLMADPAVATLYGAGYSNTVTGFPSVAAYSSGDGFDQAFFSDSAGPADTRNRNDTFTANSLSAELKGPGYLLRARLFDEVHAQAGLGHDVAWLYGTWNGSDLLDADAAGVALSGPGPNGGVFANYARAFDEIHTSAVTGEDTAVLRDAVVDVVTYGQPDNLSAKTIGQVLWLKHFERIELRKSGASEKTEIHDVDRVFAYWQ